MQIEIYQEFKAQRLDDEGDPVGDIVTLPAGKYNLRSGFNKVAEDSDAMSVWIEDLDGDLYEAQGLRVG